MRFANETVMDKDTCRDFLSLTWSRNAGPVRVLLLATAMFSIFWSGFQLYNYGPGQWKYALGIFILGAVALFLGQWGYLLRLGQYTKAQQTQWKHPTLKKEVFFYEQEFIQRSELGELHFRTCQIDKLLANKRCFVICMGPHALLLKRDGFRHGAQEDFIKYICAIIAQNKKDKKQKQKAGK